MKKNTKKVLGILVTQLCNRTVAFAKLSKIKEWITYNVNNCTIFFIFNNSFLFSDNAYASVFL